MNRKEKIKSLLSKKHTRIALCEKSFECFFVFYFKKDIHYKKFGDFHKERFKAVEKEKKIFAKGMRGIAKTTILGIANVIRRIVYNKNNFFCTLCYDVSKAKGLNGMIRNELARNEKIISDFGLLYKMGGERGGDAGYDTKGIGEFVTENSIKVKAYGMGSTLRGEIHDHKKKGKVRPDFLLVDDIDNNDNTKNKRIIQDDMDFIYSEVLAGMEQGSYNVVWLGNVIRMDGRNVRQETIAKADNTRCFFDNFLYGTAGKTSGEITRSRYIENKEEEGYDKYGRTISVQTLREDRKEGFAQNAIGLPLTVGDVLYDREWTKYYTSEVKSYVTYIGIDPAFSLKTGSDGVGICVSSYKTEEGKTRIYIQKAFALYGKDKDEDNILKVVKELYKQFHASRVYIENNNGGAIVERILQKNYLATETIKTTRDKATRFLEIKGHFLKGEVLFKQGQTEQLLEQLNVFTGEDGGQDDIVDAMICSIAEKKGGSFL